MNELYHYGTKGQKWGVRRFQNKDGSLTPQGRKRYGDGGKVYTISGKVSTTDGKKAYVATVGTKNAKSGGNIGNIYGEGSSKKEAVRNAEYELKKYLDKKNDPHYESRSTEKLRNKLQKQNLEDLQRMTDATGDKRKHIIDNNPDIRDSIANVKKSLEKCFVSEKKLYEVEDEIRKTIDFDNKVNDEYNRKINDYKKRGYRDDYIDYGDVIQDAESSVFEKYIMNEPSYRKARAQLEKDMSNYSNDLDTATKNVLGKYGDRPITLNNSSKGKTIVANIQLHRLLVRNTIYD